MKVEVAMLVLLGVETVEVAGLDLVAVVVLVGVVLLTTAVGGLVTVLVGLMGAGLVGAGLLLIVEEDGLFLGVFVVVVAFARVGVVLGVVLEALLNGLAVVGVVIFIALSASFLLLLLL